MRVVSFSSEPAHVTEFYGVRFVVSVDGKKIPVEVTNELNGRIVIPVVVGSNPIVHPTDYIQVLLNPSIV